MKNKMNVLKKLLALGLVLGLAVNLTGCAKKDAMEATEADTAIEAEADAAMEAEATATEEAATTEEAPAATEEKAGH
jgi:hypothetical protein